MRLARVPAPRSSTHCELVALNLALQLRPSQILTDSLAALMMLQRWGSWPPQRTLCTLDRVEVRSFLHEVRALGQLPQLVKVKAHDEAALRIGHPRAVGNDQADALAKRATTEAGHLVWVSPEGPHGDPVGLVGADGRLIGDVQGALEEVWWARRHRSQAKSRPWLECLGPRGGGCKWIGRHRPGCSGGRR